MGISEVSKSQSFGLQRRNLTGDICSLVHFTEVKPSMQDM